MDIFNPRYNVEKKEIGSDKNNKISSDMHYVG